MKKSNHSQHGKGMQHGSQVYFKILVKKALSFCSTRLNILTTRRVLVFVSGIHFLLEALDTPSDLHGRSWGRFLRATHKGRT